MVQSFSKFFKAEDFGKGRLALGAWRCFCDYSAPSPVNVDSDMCRGHACDSANAREMGMPPGHVRIMVIIVHLLFRQTNSGIAKTTSKYTARTTSMLLQTPGTEAGHGDRKGPVTHLLVLILIELILIELRLRVPRCLGMVSERQVCVEHPLGLLFGATAAVPPVDFHD